MKEQLVTFETAKLAFRKGFKIGDKGYCVNMYCVDGDLSWEKLGYENKFPNDLNVGFILAPSQAFLQKWLRDEFHILVEVIFDTVTFGYRIFNPHKVDNYFTTPKWENWNYEEALEVGLQEALKLIKT